MMNDIYLEYILKKKKTGGQKAIIAVIIFAAIIVSLALLLLIFATATALSGTQFGSFSFSIGLVLIAFAWYGAYLLMSMQNIEYEYILTNSEIDIDKIMSKKARKRIASFDFKEINICANINDNEHNHDYKNVTKLLTLRAISREVMFTLLITAKTVKITEYCSSLHQR